VYDWFKFELDYFVGFGCIEIVKCIEVVCDEGDLCENGGYYVVKEE